MLVQLGPDLWTDDDTIAIPGGVRLPVRMTIARLPRGGLVVHSPIALTDDRLKAIARLDAVEYLIAPSLLHHRFAGDWLQRFAGAKLYGAPGLERKRKDLRFSGMLGADAAEPPPWSSVLEPLLLLGAPKMNEVVFLHRPSGSLLVSDLLFNMTEPVNLPTRLVLIMMGTRGRLAMSRAWRTVTKDRAALRGSLEQVLRWPFTRILPGHGTIFEDPQAPEKARAALAWGLEPG